MIETPVSGTLDFTTAARLATIALGHVTREQPNVIAHVSPKSVHPIFFGSYDWHSCVHSYWLLATLYRLFPKLPQRGEIATLFADALTAEKVNGELAYLERATARGFERPYGWAWLLMLQAELDRHTGREGNAWASALKPLATSVRDSVSRPSAEGDLSGAERRAQQHRVRARSCL